MARSNSGSGRDLGDVESEGRALDHLQVPSHGGGIHRLRANPQGTHFATASRDNTAQVIDAQTGQRKGFPFSHPGALYGVSLREDGHLATACGDRHVRHWRPAPGSLHGSSNFGESSTGGVVYTTDGRFGLAQDRESATVFEPLSGKRNVVSFNPGLILYGLAASPDGQRIAASGAAGSVSFWEVATGKQIGTEQRIHTSTVYTIASSDDGAWMVSGGLDGYVQRWNARTGEPDGRLCRLGFAVRSVRFLPHQHSLVVAAKSDGEAEIIDLETGQSLAEFQGHLGSLTITAISPDGKLLATGSFDNTVRIWDLAARLNGDASAEPKVLRHPGPIWYALSFNDDGTAVVTGSEDGTARVWDVATGQPIGPILKHNSVVKAARFTANGSQVMTADESGEVRVWNLDSQPLVQAVEEIKLWLEVATGIRLNDEGEFEVLSIGDWKQRRDQLGKTTIPF